MTNINISPALSVESQVTGQCVCVSLRWRAYIELGCLFALVAGRSVMGKFLFLTQS